MDWKQATCEKCVFNVAESCRRFPSTLGYPDVRVYDGGMDFIVYSQNENGTLVAEEKPPRSSRLFNPACAEYQEVKPVNES